MTKRVAVVGASTPSRSGGSLRPLRVLDTQLDWSDGFDVEDLDQAIVECETGQG
jgi:hypothetical protein